MANGGGGGFHNVGMLTVTNSTVSGNSAGTDGGGILNDGNLVLTSVSIAGNRASGVGGGLTNVGTTTLTDSTISGNEAGADAGGLNNRGNLVVTNSTITGNVAETGSGGGIRNISGTTDLENSMVAGNTALTGPDCSGSPTSLGYNLIGNDSGCGFTADTGDLVNVDPKLGPLQDNGGPTLTHALLPGSPAIDAGDNESCPETDQRGFHRPVDGDRDGTARCDIGAYEFGASIPGDANGDGAVDVADLRVVADAMGTANGADLNGDGLVDVKDLVVPARNLGKLVSPGTGPAPVADGQIFDVSLAPVPPDDPPHFPPSCSDDRPFAFISKGDIEAMTFQYRFARVDGQPAISLAVSNLDRPLEITSGTAPLGGEGNVFVFENLTTGVRTGFGGSTFRFKRGHIDLVDSNNDGLVDTLLLSDVEGEVTTIAGDVIDQCGFSATGQGGLDTTPPSVFFTGGTLLADSSFSVWFSELIELEGVDGLIGVVDSSGAEVGTLPEFADAESGFTVPVRGFWPLGQSITVTVNPGIEDRAGNRTSDSFTQAYMVIDDPGILDNFGFESGDFSGYTVIGTPIEVTNSFLGIVPTEGARMAAIGSLSPCVSGGVSLTSRTVVPDGASHLILDYNLVITPMWASLIGPSARASSPLISGTLRGDDSFREFRQDHPKVEDTSELPDGLRETRFQQLVVPVEGLAGQEVCWQPAKVGHIGTREIRCVESLG